MNEITNSKSCPICGENQFNKIESNHSLSDPFGGEIHFVTHELECLSCGEKGDFFNENESLILNAQQELKSRAAKNIIDEFSNANINFSNIERSLSLPQRTLTKWRNESTKPSAAAVALLKFIKTFPWLLEVSDNQFAKENSQKIFLKTAFNQLINNLNFKESDFFNSGILTSSSTQILFFQFTKNENLETSKQTEVDITSRSSVNIF